jgi:hypothetical protein
LHGSRQNSFEIVPSRGGQFQDAEPRIEPYQKTLEEGDATTRHIRNFLDCVKTRQEPNCSLIRGHRSTMFAHLANIAWETRSRLDWDMDREQILGNTEANEMLRYEYRAPWDQVLKSLI